MDEPRLVSDAWRDAIIKLAPTLEGVKVEMERIIDTGRTKIVASCRPHKPVFSAVVIEEGAMFELYAPALADSLIKEVANG